MRLIDIVCGPWAITTEMLLEIQNIYGAHIRKESIDLDAIEAKVGRKLDNRYETFQIIDGVAVIPVEGVMAKRMNLFARISGGASTELIGRDFQVALADPAVKGIILAIDSPGGTVDGTSELGDLVFQSRGQKPVIAFSDGMICSAAYWVASAADSIYISGDTNPIGSIGVVAAHRDYSKYEERSGVKTTEITAGKYKRVTSQYAPLTKEGKADIQEKVDYLYSAFVNAVARNRGVSADRVVADMADGKVFTGKQSIAAGLVDGVSSLDALIEMMQDPQKREQMMKRKKPAATTAAKKKEVSMDITMLKESHPDLVAQIEAAARQGMVTEADAAASLATAVAEATASASTTERERVVALVSAAFGEEPGKKFAAVVAANLSAESMKDLGISIAPASSATDEASRKEILEGLKDAAADPVKGTKLVTGADAERAAAAKAIADGGSARR